MGLPPGPPPLTTQKSSDYMNERPVSSNNAQVQTLTQEVNPEIIDILKSRLSFILRLSRKQLSSQSLKIKSPIYKMLEVLVKLLKGSFESELSLLLNDIVKYMNNERTEVRIYLFIFDIFLIFFLINFIILFFLNKFQKL